MNPTEIEEARAVGLPEAEFDGLLSDIRRWMEKLRDGVKDLAPRLARLSHVQVRRLKRELRGVIGADHVDRLILMGRGLMGAHLALPEISIKAADFRCLSRSDQEKLNDAKAVFPVVSEKGVTAKTVTEMTPMDFARIIDREHGLLTERQQRQRIERRIRTSVGVLVPEDRAETVISLGRVDAETLLLRGSLGGEMLLRVAQVAEFVR